MRGNLQEIAAVGVWSCLIIKSVNWLVITFYSQISGNTIRTGLLSTCLSPDYSFSFNSRWHRNLSILGRSLGATVEVPGSLLIYATLIIV